MTAVLVDGNGMLDLMIEDPNWFSWSADALARAAGRSRLVINALIHGEISVRYSRIEDLGDVLPKN